MVTRLITQHDHEQPQIVFTKRKFALTLLQLTIDCKGTMLTKLAYYLLKYLFIKLNIFYVKTDGVKYKPTLPH